MASDSKLSSNCQKNVLKESLIGSGRSDIIDDIPEHLVIHILSFLPTKEAIKTSILSKRWKYRWTSISNIDINDNDIVYVDTHGKIIVGNDDRFSEWVDRVMLHLKPTVIDKFSLTLCSYDDITRINKWISAAVLRNVRDLTLYMYSFPSNDVDVAASIFYCKTLEVLTLVGGVLIFRFPEQKSVCFPTLKCLSLEEVEICGIPSAEKDYVCFPKLETLRLEYVKFSFMEKGDNVVKLVTNCPVLQDLHLRRSVLQDVPNNDLCIPALTTCILDFSCYNVNRSVEIGSQIKCLGLINWKPSKKIILRKLDSLIEARLHIRGYKNGDYKVEQREEFLKLGTLVDKVCCLHLSGKTVNVVRDCKIALPTFCNLGKLEVDMKCQDLCMLQYILDKSINLRALIIQKRESPPCLNKATQWTELSSETKCLVASLKSIEIRGCNCCADESAVIKSLLKCAKLLKRFTLKPLVRGLLFGQRGNILSKEQPFNQEILTFPRASASVDFQLLQR